jgi:predicted metalloendopeptidase
MKAQCIVDQFDQYVDKQINKNINGMLTQSENIADSGGLKQAFKVIEFSIDLYNKRIYYTNIILYK